MAKKSKMSTKNLICAVVSILMGALLIGAYFIPVLNSNVGGGISCADIIADGSNDACTAMAVMGLINMILGCLLIFGALVSIFAKVKYLDLCMICLSVLITILAIVMVIITFTQLGTTLFGLGEITLNFGAFAFLIAGVVATVANILQRKK